MNHQSPILLTNPFFTAPYLITHGRDRERENHSLADLAAVTEPESRGEAAVAGETESEGEGGERVFH